MLTSKVAFHDVYTDFVRRLEAAKEMHVGNIQQDEDDDFYLDAQTEAYDAAYMDARGENLHPWDYRLGLGERNYNAVGLFSADVGSVRSQPHLGIKVLGCLRPGWPVDKAASLYPDPFEDDRFTDPNLHSRSFCTLEGLFDVDWSMSCASTARSGRCFRPKGPVRSSPIEMRLERLRAMVARLLEVRPAANVEAAIAAKHENEDEGEEEEGEGAATSSAEGPSGVSRADLLNAAGIGYVNAHGPWNANYNALMNFKQGVLAGECSPAEFRLLVCFDN